MEQNNELNQNQMPVQNDIPVQSNEEPTARSSQENLEVSNQDILEKAEPKIEEKEVQSYADQIAVLKKEMEKMKETIKSLSHHDLGTGQLNVSRTLDKTKTLEQHVAEHVAALTQRS